MILPFPQAPVRITVDPDRILNRITPAMYGACIEDVNHEIYGGLYAQRIFGESFEEPAPGTSPQGWRALGGGWYPDGPGAVHSRGGDGPKLVREMPDLADGTVETGFDSPTTWARTRGSSCGCRTRASARTTSTATKSP